MILAHVLNGPVNAGPVPNIGHACNGDSLVWALHRAYIFKVLPSYIPQLVHHWICQWKFQDPKMEVLYHTRPYFVGIFPYIGLIYGRYLHFRILKFALNLAFHQSSNGEMNNNNVVNPMPHTFHLVILQIQPCVYIFLYIITVTDRILEMKKGSRAAGIGKGSGPKPRQKISDITDFQKNKIWK